MVLWSKGRWWFQLFLHFSPLKLGQDFFAIWLAHNFSNRLVQPPGRIASNHFYPLTFQRMLLGPMDIWRWEMNLVKSYRSIFWVSSYSVGDCLSELFCFFLPYFRYFEVDRFSRILENNPLLLIERVSADRVLANFWAPAVSGTGVQLGGKRNSSRLWPKVRGFQQTRSIHTGLGAK